MIQQKFARSLRSLARQQSQCLRTPSSPITRTFAPQTISSPPSRNTLGRRWYSSAQESEKKQEQEQKEQADAQGTGDNATFEGAAKENPLQSQLDAAQKEVTSLMDRLKRSGAEFQNLQAQTKRETKAARDFALQSFSKDLLESIDNLDRALENVPKEKLTPEHQDLLTLHDGLKMTEKILMQTLAKHGLERFDPSEAGDQFDPNRHEAMFQAPMQGKEDGSCFHTQQKGFALNGRILRAAKVGVAKNS